MYAWMLNYLVLLWSAFQVNLLLYSILMNDTGDWNSNEASLSVRSKKSVETEFGDDSILLQENAFQQFADVQLVVADEFRVLIANKWRVGSNIILSTEII